MARVVLESAHLLRLAKLLSRLREAATGEDAERAGRAATWLEEQVTLQVCPEQSLRDFVNSIRREWLEFPTFTAQEEFHFRAQQQDLARLKAEDWEMMRDFLSYIPRQGERIFQVESREFFLKSPKETLTKARSWHRTHYRRVVVPFDPSTRKYPEPEMDPETKQIFQELFGNLLPPKPEPPPTPKPLPTKTDASGQTRFID
jgi:hypothetical protein